jgi:ribonuclease P protein component
VSTRTGGFRRAERLRRSWEFRRASRIGERKATRHFVVLVAPSAGAGETRRLGLTVSRRVGNAVTRNRVKRGIREWFRRERERLPVGADIVVIAREPAADLSGGELGRALDELARDPWTRPR